MNRISRSERMLAYLALSAALFGLIVAPPARAAEAGGFGTTTVTAVGKKQSPPPIKKDDVELFKGKERVQVADWKRGETLFLAILIDDSLDSGIASQWNDLKAFIDAQPQTTYIAVAYSRNASAAVVQDFTNDHALANKALRMPIGSGGAFSSPYLSVQDWIKRWPDHGGDRRSIIMISSASTTSAVASTRSIRIWIPPSSKPRKRTSTSGPSTIPMPDTSAAVNSASSTHNRISAAFPKKPAPNRTISVRACR